MPGINSNVLLRNVIAQNKGFIEACASEDVSVICINRETKKSKYISFKVLFSNNSKFWSLSETWDYYISNDDFQKLKNKMEKTAGWVPIIVTGDQAAPDELPAAEANVVEQSFGKEYVNFASMKEPERVMHLNEDKRRLDSLIAQKPRQKDLVAEALVSTTRDAFLHNHVAVMDAMSLSDEEAKKKTQSIVDSTYELVKSSTKLISESVFNDELMNTLVAKSNGTIIQHMTRVHLNGLAFLYYYNKLVSSSSEINKLRVSFDTKFRHFYEPLLPHIHPDQITLEKVFLGGMRAITETDFNNWAVGFLIHDIGKASAIEYHEGEAAYNRDVVVEHVKVGYNSVMNKTNYPRDAGLITGYHHEYYGDSAGYGYFRSYLEQYKKNNPQARQNFCITYELEPMVDCGALAFFPAKILEIIDVFDSVTDPNRKYRKALTTEEALAMMEEEFIIKHPKLDIILFDIFKRFVRKEPSA
ncbi:MAG: metal-dependent phosphohydrolase [Treponema sp.]|nr:metal-dependent phosphohydrolase [Treponema sp.]MCL2127996.1 metal-dependent phosphohydrolase [Treponema sp.]MCL2128046.1 metal-dependent phosphohydrolase [Treponema sp.]